MEKSKLEKINMRTGIIAFCICCILGLTTCVSYSQDRGILIIYQAERFAGHKSIDKMPRYFSWYIPLDSLKNDRSESAVLPFILKESIEDIELAVKNHIMIEYFQSLSIMDYRDSFTKSVVLKPMNLIQQFKVAWCNGRHIKVKIFMAPIIGMVKRVDICYDGGYAFYLADNYKACNEDIGAEQLEIIKTLPLYRIRYSEDY